MNELNIAAPLAAALAAKGYEALTPVQMAVLADEVEGRDALVSAQTGSGKTVAFGLAMAPEVLAGADRLLFADTPLSLIIAPTRELAQQVARELDWLYAEAGAIIATCVGGMDYRAERRTLERGAHIVVGTPGRLRDHIERGSLDLSKLKVAVLDEADEMLDLGFAEDLEFILSSAPEERRTLMFSATVPKEIAELAKSFQRDALRLQTQGEAKQHVDIEYRALNVTARDKEHAIFNALRYYEARTAIVFCKTRMNVNHLLARMGNRGFQVVALSGELSQTERMHALQALRDGRARVCIATDVAARGIDLPGLELVIHADLPSNSETLLHRSGRTGRAGQKGVSALIVPPAEFRKAQRLLAGAKVVAEWAKAPSAEEVQERDDARLLDHPALAQAPGDEAALAQTLLARHDADHIAAAFVRLWREGRSAPEVLQDSLPPAGAQAPRERGEFGDSVWFSLSVGHTGRAEARWLLPKICDATGITKNEIGAIRVQQDNTFVQIAKAVAGKFGARMEIEPGVDMTRLDGEPNLARPERPAPRPRGDKPAYTPKPSRFVEDGEEAAPRKPYVKREAASDAKPYAKRDDAERKPYTPREGAERKPYAPRADAERKPYTPREGAERKPWSPEESDRKPYAPREAAERKPYGDRKTARGEAETERRTYAPRSLDPAKRAPRPAGEDGPRKPYAKRDDAAGPKKPYAPRAEAPAEGGERKARWKTGDRPAEKPAARSAGYKSFGGGADKPARAGGFKSHASEGKTFGKPGAKAKPAPARFDAKDTSKRFVPPKKK
ncbi:ATP-dependent RNA helicase DeaD [Gemmobacter aquatilis]|uniref:ATP-dependent RNA helicase DeaD n=1 Tax=Gemmobacter aquatilis TaxID=933059 RepID=A0A1H8JM94_9RHOB|nr:DEAD/DEAH box helicase [Gemmobacter aquatilis]SEN81655.1 ATP-dependent RNA helicase DeaD [Gemmobacter aquatilis]